MRLVVASRVCPFCRGFHVHRLWVDRNVSGPVVVYSTCPETQNRVPVTVEVEP